jgi:hypothetical protein
MGSPRSLGMEQSVVIKSRVKPVQEIFKRRSLDSCKAQDYPFLRRPSQWQCSRSPRNVDWVPVIWDILISLRRSCSEKKVTKEKHGERILHVLRPVQMRRKGKGTSSRVGIFTTTTTTTPTTTITTITTTTTTITTTGEPFSLSFYARSSRKKKRLDLIICTSIYTIQSLIYSFTHSIIHSINRSLVHSSIAQSLTYSITPLDE